MAATTLAGFQFDAYWKTPLTNREHHFENQASNF